MSSVQPASAWRTAYHRADHPGTDQRSLQLGRELDPMRFVELRLRLYRLLSVLKVRDSDFDLRLYGQGLAIEDSPDSAEAITAGLSRQPEDVPSEVRPLRARRGS